MVLPTVSSRMYRWLLWLLPALAGVTLGRAQTFSLTPAAATYASTGGTLVFTAQITYSGSLTSIGFQLNAPAGWEFVGAGSGNPPQIQPAVGNTGIWEFAYTNIPASPLAYSFTVRYPAGLSTSQKFDVIAAVLRGGSNASGPVSATASM